MKNNIKPANKQTGVVLIVSLIMLLLLTLIGLTGTQATSLEERMAGNAQDQNIAFQAAESALLEAEKFVLENSTSVATYSGVAGLLDLADPEPADYFAADVWTAANSTATPNGFASKFTNSSNVAIADPRYVIKKVPPVGGNPTFKITVRAVGISPGTQVILQEIFSKI